MLEEAIKLSTKLQKWQKRRSWEEYIVHPLSVMNILKSFDFSEEVLVAWVLHDICEDTETTNIEIREIFWERVWFIVNALSKNRKPKNNKELKLNYEIEKKNNSKNSTFEEYVDYRFFLYLNRFSMWIFADPRIMFIKIADQIDNTKSLDVFPKDKRDRKIEELEKHFLPLYERMTEILTPRYMDKYKKMIQILNENIAKAKALN